jgi:hypothetical protein
MKHTHEMLVAFMFMLSFTLGMAVLFCILL